MIITAPHLLATLPKAALPHCFTYSDGLVLLAHAKHSIHQHTSSFSAGLLLTVTSQHIQMHRVIPPPVQGLAPCLVSPRFLLAQSSSFSRFLCTEALPFSIWITFPNLELSPDLLRTCFTSRMVSEEYSEQSGLQYRPCLLAAVNHFASSG